MFPFAFIEYTSNSATADNQWQSEDEENRPKPEETVEKTQQRFDFLIVICPYPKVGLRRETRKGRQKGRSRVLTETPEKRNKLRKSKSKLKLTQN